jgi:hypothetical protein
MSQGKHGNNAVPSELFISEIFSFLCVIYRWQVGKVRLAASCSKFDATFKSSAYRCVVFVSINFADSSGDGRIVVHI